MLPKVKKEILDSVVSSGDITNANFIREKLEKIKDENGILFSLLVTITNRQDWSNQEKNCYVLGATIFYILLSMQDDSDELQEIFPL